ncbi:hypothetical protein HDF15_001117 [Granulicella mallensis]|uniref:Uncharacterized protein n=1 Tax=Granulicella mallensis TaxID=940614 RepID=A0A7W8E9W5_9BACT|nr:hypothetical protein [Granulicella mallensis]
MICGHDNTTVFVAEIGDGKMFLRILPRFSATPLRSGLAHVKTRKKLARRPANVGRIPILRYVRTRLRKAAPVT